MQCIAVTTNYSKGSAYVVVQNKTLSTVCHRRIDTSSEHNRIIWITYVVTETYSHTLSRQFAMSVLNEIFSGKQRLQDVTVCRRYRRVKCRSCHLTQLNMMLYIYLTAIVSAYIRPSSGQNINHENKYA
jgi:hypothetical protein